jgi:hypothetical protein
MDETNESTAPTEAEVRLALLRFLQSSANSHVDLAPLQKRIPLQFLALRNAHGDFGAREYRNAFLTHRPIVLFPCEGESSTVRVSFSAPLPAGTTKVTLRGRKANGSAQIANHCQPGTVTIERTGLNDFGDQDQFVVEVADDQDVLLAIGIPTIDHASTSSKAYSSVSTAQGE